MRYRRLAARARSHSPFQRDAGLPNGPSFMSYVNLTISLLLWYLRRFGDRLVGTCAGKTPYKVNLSQPIGGGVRQAASGLWIILVSNSSIVPQKNPLQCMHFLKEQSSWLAKTPANLGRAGCCSWSEEPLEFVRRSQRLGKIPQSESEMHPTSPIQFVIWTITTSCHTLWVRFRLRLPWRQWCWIIFHSVMHLCNSAARSVLSVQVCALWKFTHTALVCFGQDEVQLFHPAV